MAGQREYATVLAYHRSVLQVAADDSGKPGLCVHPQSGAFLRSFLAFSHSKVVSDDPHAPGVEIGRPKDSYRRIRIESTFGKLTVLVTDGHLPYPYGRETTGYEVANLTNTLAKATAAGVEILVPPYTANQRNAAFVQFPGGYIAEVHSPVSN
jgi:hypothetical protein